MSNQKIAIDLEKGGNQTDQDGQRGPAWKKMLIITTAILLAIVIIAIIGLAAAGVFSNPTNNEDSNNNDKNNNKQQMIPNEKLIAAADTIECSIIEEPALKLEPATIISMPPVTSLEYVVFSPDRSKTTFFRFYPCNSDGTMNPNPTIVSGTSSEPGGPGIYSGKHESGSKHGICGIGSVKSHTLQLRSLMATCDPSKTKKCTNGFSFPKFSVESGVPSPLVVNGTAQVKMNSCKKVKAANGNIEIPVTGRNAPTQPVDLVRFHLKGIVTGSRYLIFDVLPFDHEVEFVVEDSIGSGSFYTVESSENSTRIQLPVNEKQTLLVRLITNQDVLNSTLLHLSPFEIAT